MVTKVMNGSLGRVNLFHLKIGDKKAAVTFVYVDHENLIKCPHYFLPNACLLRYKLKAPSFWEKAKAAFKH